MALPLLLRNPRFVQWAVRLDTAPAWWWPAAQLATLALVWLRVRQPLPGLLTLALVAALLWPRRSRLRAAPRLGWLALALACTASIPLACAGPAGPALTALAVLALVGGTMAFLPGQATAHGAAVTSAAFGVATARSGPAPLDALLGNTFLNRVLYKAAFGLVLALCAAWALAQAAGRA